MRMLTVMLMIMMMMMMMMMMMKIISHAFLRGSVLSVQNGCLFYVAERIRRALIAPRASGASPHLHVSLTNSTRVQLTHGSAWAPAGGAVTKKESTKTHTDGRLMLLM